MAHLVTALSAGKFFGQTGIEDDIVDRMHYIFTSAILVVFAIGVSWKQFGGKPIECSIPEQVPGIGAEEYVEMYCFAKDTYFVPWDENVPRDSDQTRRERISYYQWVPFFLLAQALLFRIPCMWWKLVASHSGIKVHHLVQQATNERNIDLNVRQNTIQMLSIHIENALRYHRRVYRRKLVPHAVLRFMNLPYSSAYVAMMYLTTKLLYLFNVVTSFIWLNMFMLDNDRYEFYGLDAFRDLINGTHWEHSGLFPRVTICDFPVRTLGQVQHYSVQCAMIINLLNEKIFVFLWCWYVVLTSFTLISTLYWAAVVLLPWFRRWFIVRHLELADMPFDAKESSKEVDRFVFNFLHIDGVFILRMVTGHAGVVMGTDLTMTLWKRFYGISAGYAQKLPAIGATDGKEKKEGEDTGTATETTKSKQHANDVKPRIDEPDSADANRYIPDFTKSPIFKEEQAYDEAIQKIRRRSSAGLHEFYQSGNNSDRSDQTRSLLTSVVTAPIDEGSLMIGDVRERLGSRLMMAMHDRNAPVFSGQTPVNASPSRRTHTGKY